MSPAKHRRSAKPRPGRWLLVAALVGFAIVLLRVAFVNTSPASAQAAQTTPISVKQDSLNQPCENVGWHFVINQVKDGPAPTSITVFWSDGTSTVVALSPPVTQNVAHYIAAPNPNGSTVIDATSEIYQGWTGNFNLSGCKAPSTTTPPSSPSSTPSTPESTPPTSPDTTPSTPETTPTSPESTPTSPDSTPSSPDTTPPASQSTSATDTPPAGTSSSDTPPTRTSSSDTPPVATSTSPFVPGAGETGDTPPGGGFPLRLVLIGLAVVMLGAAGATTFQLLRRSGNHA